MLSDKMRKVIAIISLVFMAVFTVCLPIYFAKPKAWDGRVATITLYSGIVGIMFFFLIWLDNKARSRHKKMQEFIAKEKEEFDKNNSGSMLAPSTINSDNNTNNQSTESVNKSNQPSQKMVSKNSNQPKGKNDLSDKDLA